MENASKALLMAAGVLIGILILSLAVYLFTNFGAASAEAHRQNAANQVNQFNVQFTAYEGRSDITIHDILTVVNLAKNSNESFGLTSQEPSNYYIAVTAKTASGGSITERSTTSQLEELVRKELDNLVQRTDDDGVTTYKALPTYSCKVTINPNTERVSTVTFNLN